MDGPRQLFYRLIIWLSLFFATLSLAISAFLFFSIPEPSELLAIRGAVESAEHNVKVTNRGVRQDYTRFVVAGTSLYYFSDSWNYGRVIRELRPGSIASVLAVKNVLELPAGLTARPSGLTRRSSLPSSALLLYEVRSNGKVIVSAEEQENSSRRSAIYSLLFGAALVLICFWLRSLAKERRKEYQRLDAPELNYEQEVDYGRADASITTTGTPEHAYVADISAERLLRPSRKELLVAVTFVGATFAHGGILQGIMTAALALPILIYRWQRVLRDRNEPFWTDSKRIEMRDASLLGRVTSVKPTQTNRGLCRNLHEVLVRIDRIEKSHQALPPGFVTIYYLEPSINSDNPTMPIQLRAGDRALFHLRYSDELEREPIELEGNVFWLPTTRDLSRR